LERERARTDARKLDLQRQLFERRAVFEHGRNAMTSSGLPQWRPPSWASWRPRASSAVVLKIWVEGGVGLLDAERAVEDDERARHRVDQLIGAVEPALNVFVGARELDFRSWML